MFGNEHMVRPRSCKMTKSKRGHLHWPHAFFDLALKRIAFAAQGVVALPLTGTHDLQARFERSIVELDRASKRLDDKACVVIKEALNIFSAALNRLWLLDSQRC